MELNTKQIMEILPHRAPFLLIDRIEELEPGKRAVGRKAVTYNEPFFAGHFPQEEPDAFRPEHGVPGNVEHGSGPLKAGSFFQIKGGLSLGQGVEQ